MSSANKTNKLDVKSLIIGVLSTILVLVLFYIPRINAEPQEQQQGSQQDGNIVVRSLTVVNQQGNPVFQLSADSTGNGVLVLRNRNNVPMVLMRSVQDNQSESGMIYCNGLGIWGEGGKVNTLINANKIQYLNQ